MPSMNISLTPELLHIVQDKVESGMYNNASEVVREAIRQLDMNSELLYQLKLTHLKKALEVGIRQAENGEVSPLTLQDVLREIDTPKHT